MANMINAVMPMRTGPAPAKLPDDSTLAEPEFTAVSEAEDLEPVSVPLPRSTEPTPTAQPLSTPVPPLQTAFGWPVPSCISPNPEQARASIQLPAFDDFLLERARVISSRFPFAEAEYRHLWGKEARAEHLEIPHFERVF